MPDDRCKKCNGILGDQPYYLHKDEMCDSEAKEPVVDFLMRQFSSD